jgi:VWFA-related protein
MSSSPEARRLSLPRGAAKISFRGHHLFLSLLFSVCWVLSCSMPARAQSASPQVPASDAQSDTKQNSSEISSHDESSTAKQNSVELASHDEPTTFKVNVKLVVVRAVVRDAQGHAVGNLTKDDFELFDKGKPQVISQFEVEQPGALTAKAQQKSDENSADQLAGDTSSNSGNAPPAPEHFVAYLFDDVHLAFGDLSQVRKAAEHHFATLRPTDRAAIFTTSGVTILDFTDDRAKLHEALLHLQPRSIAGGPGQDCLRITYYQADQIVNKHDPLATQVALQEEIACNPPPPGVPPPNPAPVVQAVSAEVLSAGDHESRISLGVLNDVVHNLSRMPGQRSIVVISPGFIAPQMEHEYTDIVDRAVRSQIIINTLDARGLYVVVPGGDISNPPLHPPPPAKNQIEIAAAAAQDDLLAVLAESTGGVFFQNNNDFNEGFRRVAETPAYSYVLAFAPQNLKLDGSFHSLKVKLKAPQKRTLQARRGYYAPKGSVNQEEQAKQELEDETFSQEELHNLPVKLHTQFFKSSDQDAKLTVLAHVDVRLLHFKKVDGRNNNVLTCVSALFNRDGRLVEGMQKTVTMHLKDDTLEHKLASGITLKTTFDVKPGSYVVRLVVRDAEGQSMSAENGTVEIR